jgi:phosphoribosylanthranilate isomerase
MKPPLVKICGFTEPQDARHAVLAGVDLLGLNFHAESVRAVDFLTAKLIAQVARQTFNPQRRGFKPAIVAVFVNPPSELVEGVLRDIQPDLLQFHGDESPAECSRYGHPFIKAIRLKNHHNVDSIESYITSKSKTFLVDTYSPLSFGGTGQRISLDLAKRALGRGKGFLAGGLTADNVGHIIQQVNPYGVDVASGVESRPGKKSQTLMHSFVREVHSAYDVVPPE